MRTVLSTDNGNEWRPVTPPPGSRDMGCRMDRASGEWRGPGGVACGLQLRLGRKLKGVPGKWELRQHKQVRPPANVEYGVQEEFKLSIQEFKLST